MAAVPHGDRGNLTLSSSDDGSGDGGGGSVLDRLIGHVPIEMHLPGYQFLGPGTHLDERLSRGERGINPLDNACLAHDMAYTRKENHTKADRALAERAFSRMLSETVNGDEKTAAIITVCCMVTKITFDRFLRRAKRTIKRARRKLSRSVAKRTSNGENS